MPQAVVGLVILAIQYIVSERKQRAERIHQARLRWGARGIRVNTASQVDPIPVVYGSRNVGGTRVFVEVSDEDNRYLHIVLALCEGEISAINTVYLDDVATSDARFIGTNPDESPVDLVTVEKVVGTDSQAALSNLTAAVPAWTSNHRLRGTAYVYVRLQWNESVFPGGMPVITCDVDGKKVYDPRDGATKFSNNPALVIRDYMVNTRYGRGIPESLIDDASFSAAANHCDELVSVPDGAGGFTTQKRYTCDGVVDTSADWIDNLGALLTSCRGFRVDSGGVHKLLIEKQESTQSFAFTEDNILGDWEFSLPGRTERLNRVKARFFNEARQWQEDVAVHDDATHRAADNGAVLERVIALPFTKDIYRARQLAMLEEKDSRFGLQARFRSTVAAHQCEVGEVVPITHSTPGWSAKPFRITGLRPIEDDEVEVSVREYQDAAYSLDALTEADPIPATNLPDPFTVAAPTGLTFTQNLFTWDSAVLEWTASADVFVHEYQAEYKLETESSWTVMPRVTETSITIPRLQLARNYNFRVKALNTINRSSSYATVSGTMDGSAVHWNGSLNGEGQLQKISSIDLGLTPRGLAWCPANNLLYVGVEDAGAEIVVINPVNDQQVATIAVGNPVMDLTYCPKNGKMYAVTKEASDSVYPIDVTAFSVSSAGSPSAAPIPGSGNGVSGAPGVYCPVNERLYIATPITIKRIDPVTDTVDQTISHASGAVDSICYCPTNQLIYFSGSVNELKVLNPLTGAIVDTITISGSSRSLCYCPSNDRIYVSTSTAAIQVINPSTNVIEASITSAGSPSEMVSPGFISYCHLSDRLYFGDRQLHKVVLIRPSNNAFVGSTDVDPHVRNLAWVPTVGKVYCNTGLVSQNGKISVCSV